MNFLANIFSLNLPPRSCKSQIQILLPKAHKSSAAWSLEEEIMVSSYVVRNTHLFPKLSNKRVIVVMSEGVHVPVLTQWAE